MAVLNKIKNTNVKVAVIPLVLLLMSVLVAFFLGGVILVGQSIKQYIFGLIAVIPFILIFNKKTRSKLASPIKKFKLFKK
ncbi:MAG: hypothetical protein ACFFG0_06070 [Candidatus Thorarchaeota archaeon]